MFGRTLRDIYSKCRSIDVDFIRMDGSMFLLIFLILDRWVFWLIDELAMHLLKPEEGKEVA